MWRCFRPRLSASQVFSANLKAIEQLRASRMFRRTLRLSLQAGNFLNHGSRIGNAIGVRLKALPKLQDTKWVGLSVGWLVVRVAGCCWAVYLLAAGRVVGMRPGYSIRCIWVGQSARPRGSRAMLRGSVQMACGGGGGCHAGLGAPLHGVTSCPNLLPY